MTMTKSLVALAVLGLWAQAAQAEITAVKVERTSPDTLNITWNSPDAVDVYVADASDAPVGKAALLARGTHGAYTVGEAGTARRYFTLVDQKDHARTEAAERVVPLSQGSNFRDIGGYVGAGGKTVRWGMIYRSAGQPLLTSGDVAALHAMGLAQVVDLRSSEERVIAPSRITGVPYAAVGYSMSDLMPVNGAPLHNGVDIYHGFPTLLAPQMKLIFASLLNHQSPLVYNCSAGQDRTGFATAMILSALGVSRAQIFADYQLSTEYRRPQWEMPKLDPNSPDPVVKMFAGYQSRPPGAKGDPLTDAQGRPFLVGAFDEIDAKWGSVDGYLQKVVGLTNGDIARLRSLYLE